MFNLKLDTTKQVVQQKRMGFLDVIIYAKAIHAILNLSLGMFLRPYSAHLF